jgi:tetratricopeptide (TPR) repeat protein
MRLVSHSIIVSITLVTSLAAYADDIGRGDLKWASRAEGEREGRPNPGPILDAVSFYESALTTNPQSLEARWKLLRALHFAGDFMLEEPKEKRAIFGRAREMSNQGLDQLAQRLGSGIRLEGMKGERIRGVIEAANLVVTDVSCFYFWSAINWGAWSRTVGLLSAVRQGVANRLHDYTRIAIALEPGYEDGGALRLLGRLHAELPRVPFVSGWVKREQALPLIERAYAIAPDHPGNRLLLALTLLDVAPERRAEALDLLDDVGRLNPRASFRIEDLAMRKEAQERLNASRSEPS